MQNLILDIRKVRYKKYVIVNQKKLLPMRIHLLRIFLLFIITSCSTATEPYAQDFELVAEAGDTDRNHSIVTFTFPQSAEPGDYKLTDEEGNEQSLTITQDNTAWFVLEQLEAGSSKKFSLSIEEIMPFESSTGVYTERDG